MHVDRRHFLTTMGSAGAAHAALSGTSLLSYSALAAGQAEKETGIGYAFIDHTIVAQTFAMRREFETPQPVREGRIVEPGWAYGSVIRDSTGLFRMWYMGPPAYCEFYATSEDGIHWDKPKLDLVSPDLGAAPNAFMSKYQKDANGRVLVGRRGPEGFSVLDAEVQPHPAAKARFTALYLAHLRDDESPRAKGLCIAYSDDGIHWVAGEHNPIISGWLDTGNCLIYDERIKKYVIFGRPPVHVTPGGGRANRLLCRMESEDLVHWTSPRTIMDTDERDADGLQLSNEGALNKGSMKGMYMIRGRDRQFYGISVFPSSGVYIGLAQVYEMVRGVVWMELCYSLDGYQWFREPLREPFMAPRPGTWESALVRPAMASPPVRVDDELWIYYSASPHLHHAGMAMEGRGIGCRSLKVDRWIGYRSSTAEAELLTHAIKPGRNLQLNAKTEPGGSIRVGVIDSWGKDLDGFTAKDCAPIEGDSLQHAVRWAQGDRLPSTEGEIRLRIMSQNATLYAFSMDA